MGPRAGIRVIQYRRLMRPDRVAAFTSTGLGIVLSHLFRGLHKFHFAWQEHICVSGFFLLGLYAYAFIIPTEMNMIHRDRSIGCGMGGY